MAPKPLTANMPTETPDGPDYGTEDWRAYLCTDEGWCSYEACEEAPQEAVRHRFTLAGGNDKGKGKAYRGKG